MNLPKEIFRPPAPSKLVRIELSSEPSPSSGLFDAEHPTGKSEIGEVHGKPEPVGDAPALPDQRPCSRARKCIDARSPARRSAG